MAKAVHSGKCLCGALRIEVTQPPMIVHACHCTRCQQRTGAPIIVNLWIEQSQVRLLTDDVQKLGESVDEIGKTSL